MNCNGCFSIRFSSQDEGAYQRTIQEGKRNEKSQRKTEKIRKKIIKYFLTSRKKMFYRIYYIGFNILGIMEKKTFNSFFPGHLKSALFHNINNSED